MNRQHKRIVIIAAEFNKELVDVMIDTARKDLEDYLNNLTIE